VGWVAGEGAYFCLSDTSSSQIKDIKAKTTELSNLKNRQKSAASRGANLNSD